MSDRTSTTKTIAISFPFLRDTLMNPALKEGYALCFLLFTVLCTKTLIENQYFDQAIQLGASIRGTLSAAVYRKSLKLGPAGQQNTTMGEIVNYMQLDTSRMEYVASSIHTGISIQILQWSKNI